MAQDGDDYAWSAYNQSRAEIRQINIRAVNGTRWGQNWLRSRLQPGAEQAMRFSPRDDQCEYVVRVTWMNNYFVEDTIDFCDMTYLMIDNYAIWASDG